MDKGWLIFIAIGLSLLAIELLAFMIVFIIDRHNQKKELKQQNAKKREKED